MAAWPFFSKSAVIPSLWIFLIYSFFKIFHQSAHLSYPGKPESAVIFWNEMSSTKARLACHCVRKRVECALPLIHKNNPILKITWEERTMLNCIFIRWRDVRNTITYARRKAWRCERQSITHMRCSVRCPYSGINVWESWHWVSSRLMCVFKVRVRDSVRVCFR